MTESMSESSYDNNSSQTKSEYTKIQEKVQQLETMRKHFYDYNFPFPPITRKIAWVILVLWSAAATVTAIVYGLSFDLEVEAEDDKKSTNWDLYESGCWNTSLQLRIENELSIGYFGDEFQEREEANGSSYGGSDAGSWLLSLGQSLFLSMILWQPLNIYLLTWIRVWMFTWHLEILLPWNLTTLCARCCCGPEKDDLDDLDENDMDITEEEATHKRRLSRQESRRKTADPKLLALAENLRKSTRDIMAGPGGRGTVIGAGGQPALLTRASSKRAQVVAHESRPPDMMMFWGNEDFLIDDGPGGIQMIDIGDTADEVANFRADTFRDDAANLDRVMSQSMMSQSMTMSEEVEMQDVDVTWTKDQNGDEPRDIGIVFTSNPENGLAPIDSLSVDGPDSGELNQNGANGNHLTVEQELSNAMGAYGGGGGSEKKKRKRKKKKVAPIQHSTEWAY